MPITSIGIPSRDRPQLLARCLVSYLENARRHDRAARFVVVDDSRDPVGAKNVEAVVAQLAQNFSTHAITVLSREKRRVWAGRVAAESGFSEDVVRFALLGDDRCPSSYGAARNTLLLATAGESSVQVDDDTVCQMTASPEITDDLEYTDQHEVGAYEYSKTRRQALDEGRRVEADFLGLHERLLGATVAGKRVVTTFLGVRGDSGMRSSLNRLLLDGASFDRLIAPSEEYAWKLHTREIVRAPTRPTVSTSPVTMTINIGLDNRDLLPPFSPVLRNEDGAFGIALDLCMGPNYRGYLPWSIAHDPPGERPASTAIELPSPRFNDLLAGVLSSFSPGVMGDDPRVNLKLIAGYLGELTALPTHDFAEYVIQVGRRFLENTIEELEIALSEGADKPDFWRRDVLSLQRAYERAVNSPDYYTPDDLNGLPDERWSLAKELMGNYARVMEGWEAMWEWRE